MRVEAVRKALFGAAVLPDEKLRERLGQGILRARSALDQQPAAEAALSRQPEDDVSFPFLRVITGLGAAPDLEQRMLELECLQLTQRSQELEALLPDLSDPPQTLAEQQRLIDAFIDTPGASETLRAALARHSRRARPRIAVPAAPGSEQISRAINPSMPKPVRRRLRVFAFDPLLGTKLDTVELNQATLSVEWEELEAGPVGEYRC
jgi:hypothetical protein